MKRAFVVFGVLLGLQLAAVTASANGAANDLEIAFDLCGPKLATHSSIAEACSRGLITFDGISEISISENASNRVDFTAYARLPVDHGTGPIVSSAHFKVVFDSDVRARAFIAKVKSGRISKIVGIATRSPIDEMTYALGPIKLAPKSVFLYSK